MSRKSRKRNAEKRYKSATAIADILKDLMQKQTLPAQNPQYLRYHALLLAAIPSEWHAHIRIGKLQYQGFEIHCLDGALAYRLKFLAPEIQRLLSKSLSHPPPIVIKVDPSMKHWNTRTPPKSLPAPRARLSDAEANDILNRFFARARAKHRDSESS